ncbi:MFS family transporter [Amphibiibacter pelophylacis]|uniref:MFS family transporter n=1 Tax=Amphibiibacter pelophylacis TaxID=1799477 RepID=A0ACC6P2S0_9BURK
MAPQDSSRMADITPANRIKSIVSASSGNLVEWFDFYIYAFFSLYFAASFFPKGDTTVQLLQTAGIFAIGFLMRPIGGWFFGKLADRVGRKFALMVSIVMMCGGSLMIALLPTYAQIGVWAPLLLLLARMLQGLAVGGEYGSSATYMSEVAIDGKRGFYASFQYVTLIGGQLLAVLVVVILESLLGKEALREWGWRVPFVIGALAAVVVFYLRRGMHETTGSNVKVSKEAGTLRGLLPYKAPFFIIMGITAGGSLAFYVMTTYMQKYLVNTVGFEPKVASYIMTCALFVYMCVQPLFGAMADRIGRYNSLRWFGVLSVLLLAPIMLLLQGVSNPYIAFALIMTGLCVNSLYTSIGGIFKAEVFPAHIRALAVGLSYGVANALFGGSAEFVALNFKNMGNENGFYAYTLVICAVGWFSVWKLKPHLHASHLR